MRTSGLVGFSLVAGALLTGCTSNSPAATTITTTVTATSAPSVVVFNPATSGKELAARIALRAKPQAAGVRMTGVECKNFGDLRVGTHTDCQMRVNGVKRGFRATFTQRDGHYVLKSQKLTW